MLLEELKKIKSTPKELREFGWVMGGVFIAVAAVRVWRHGAGVWGWQPFFYVGLVWLFLGLAVPQSLKHSQRAWMALALMMGAVMSRVILCLVFFVVVTPLALILRMQGKRLLQRGGVDGMKSYWNLRGSESADSKRCERQF